MSQSLTFTVRDQQGVYVGAVVNGKANGVGQFISELYELSGIFINNKLVHGQFTHKNHYTYTGSLADNYPHGCGKITHTDKSLCYDGEWRNGKRHGYGKSLFENDFKKEKYEGEWRDDKKHGKGCLEFIINDTQTSSYIYKGMFAYDVCDGYGEIKYRCGFIYNGEWKNGKRVGQGTCYHTSMSFTGEWVDSDPAYGTYTIKRGVYIGEMKKYKQHGYGKMTYSDGTSYEGQWQNGKCNGYGTLTITNDNLYNNIYWKRNAINTHLLGAIVKGVWIDDNLKFGTITFMNGDCYEGELDDYNMVGHGTYTYTDNTTYTGMWKMNKRHNKGVLKFANGTTLDGKWNNDEFISGVMCIKHDTHTYTTIEV